MDGSQQFMGDMPEDQEERPIAERLQGLVASLASEAKRRVDRRVSVEDRWIEDLQMYHGVYDADTQEKLNSLKGSQVFVNMTATKTDAMEARLWDLLFPTDDKAWGVAPTPVPELSREIEGTEDRVDELNGDVADARARVGEAQAAGMPQIAQEAAQRGNLAQEALKGAEEEVERLNAVMDEARTRAELMEEEISDQFVQCRFTNEARDCIGWGAKIGFGVMKGPVTGQKLVQRWKQTENGYELTSDFDQTPAAYSVDPWSYFPDPDVRDIEDSEGHYERHLLNKQQMRRLSKRPDVDADAVREVLRGPPDTAPSYMTQLVDISNNSSGSVKDLYQVWEYTGPLDIEDLRLLADAFEDDNILRGLEVEDDPLIEADAKVWFCQGRVFSFALHPLDSGDPIYSVFTIRRDTSTPFGYGIPRIARDAQIVLSAAWRMMMDNSALSTGPQIAVDKDQITPQDGVMSLTPRKIWNWVSNQATNRPPITSFNVESHQQEIANIIELARDMMDEITAMPAIAEGQQGADVTKTAQGMALLMNNANVSFRRIVKMWDDFVMVPLVQRFYDFNMQFNEKEAIKGDYEVQARGSSVLLVREMQAQNLLMIALQFGAHPIYGPMLKHGDLLRQIFKAHMLSMDEVMKTDREYERDQAEQGQSPELAEMQRQNELQQQANELKAREIELKAETANLDAEVRREIAGMNYDMAMEKTAAALNMSREELDRKIGDSDAERQHSERKMAAEIAMKERTGVSSGGAI